MIWVNILAFIILALSLPGGLKEGAIKSFFSLLVLVIAIPLAGFSYRLVAVILSFLPGEDWENFIGFFIALVLVSTIMHSIFFLPRRPMQKVWKGGILFRLLGGALRLLNSGIGLVVFALAVGAYPIFGWLEQVVWSSSVLM